MDLEAAAQEFWLVSALKGTRVYRGLKSAGPSGQAALVEAWSAASGSIWESPGWLSLSQCNVFNQAGRAGAAA